MGPRPEAYAITAKTVPPVAPLLISKRLYRLFEPLWWSVCPRYKQGQLEALSRLLLRPREIRQAVRDATITFGISAEADAATCALLAQLENLESLSIRPDRGTEPADNLSPPFFQLCRLLPKLHDLWLFECGPLDELATTTIPSLRRLGILYGAFNVSVRDFLVRSDVAGLHVAITQAETAVPAIPWAQLRHLRVSTFRDMEMTDMSAIFNQWVAQVRFSDGQLLSAFFCS